VILDFVTGLSNILLFQIAATPVTLIVYLAARRICSRAIDRLVRTRQRMHPRRVASTRRTVNIIAFAFLIGTLAVVWSIDLRSVAVTSGAILASLGIAFFAQWSLLSNVTTSFIMFWRFPIHIGDRIKVLSDQPIDGTVTDLTPFFIVLEDEGSNTITIPNNISLQQSFLIYATEDSNRTSQLE
jgi:small-conductance mechanosensitive channel